MSFNAISSMNEENNASPEFWRNATGEQVEKAIEGTLLGQIYSLLQKNYAPKAPVSICLTQAIVNMSMALVHKKPDDIEQVDGKGGGTIDVANALAALDQKDPELEKKVALLLKKSFPAHRSGIYIDTKNGNVPNVYALVVAPSGFGKSLSLAKQVAEATGYREISDATLCGIYEEAMKDPHILLSFQEFARYLKTEFAVSEIRYKLTDMFNAGSFRYVKGHGGMGEELSSDWFYPILTASIQSEVLKTKASRQDIEQGVLPRFLVCYISEEEAKCHVLTKNISQEPEFNQVMLSLSKLHQQQKVVVLPDADYNTKFSEPIIGILKPGLKPFLNRYSNEYLPRIALMLAIPANYNGEPIPDITDEHMEKAKVIMYHYLYNVERAFSGVNDLSGAQKQFEENLNKMVKIMARMHGKKKGTITLTEISRVSSGTGWDQKLRMDILAEMLQRGWITVRNRKAAPGGYVQKGDKLSLNFEDLPEGIL